MKTFIRFFIFILFTGVSCAASAQIIIYPTDGSDQELLAAKEVRRYIYLRTDSLLSIESAEEIPSEEDLIVVANDDHQMIENLRDSIGGKTERGGFIIKTLSIDGRSILVITGHRSSATLHGAYRFAEKLGFGFNLAEDIIPDQKIEWQLPEFDEVGKPRFETRGIQPFHDFPSGPDLWNTNDYLAIISQLPKLGMNFIGIHTYTTWGSLYDRSQDNRKGPEPSVWIGLPEDVHEDGTVSWSYPAFYAHTKRPNFIWGFDTWDTDQFHAGAAELFPTNGYGSEVMGNTVPTDLASSNHVFNRVGEMFDASFTHADNVGVKTAIGTELPLGEENDFGETWIRGMPPLLQDHLEDKGMDPADPEVVKEVYKGIFQRIKNTHPLDYYWLWSWEIWSAEGTTKEMISSFENDIQLANEALEELGNPFQLGHAGWRIGTVDNPAEFEDVLPSEVPFFGLWGEAEGFEDLSEERVKWPATWLEYDWGLAQPQLAVYRVHEDAIAAWDKACDGFITEHWRTRIMAPNISAMKELIWAYGSTEHSVNMDIPRNRGPWIDEFYNEWATKYFGVEVGPDIASIFAELEWENLPHVMDWTEEMTGGFMAPSAILPNEQSWESEKIDFEFVDDLEKLREQVAGKGNLERFDYWLKSMQGLKIMAQYGCVRYEFEEAMNEEKYEVALEHRQTMAQLWEQIMTLQIEKVTNSSDLGEILNLEILNWKQLMINKWDDALKEGLGKEIPDSANPSRVYMGDPFIRATPTRTHIYKGEALELKVWMLGGPDQATLYYRPLGGDEYNALPLIPVARGVYKVTIPEQEQDFEYFIESESESDQGNVVYPVTAPDINQTVVVVRDTPQEYTLTTSSTNGSISPPEGVFPENSILTIVAEPDSGYEFDHWGGDLRGTKNPRTFKIDSDKEVIAYFKESVVTDTDTDISSAKNGVLVYPNPTRNSFHVKAPEVIKSIEIFDMLGKRQKQFLNVQSMHKDLSIMQEGAYIIIVTTRSKIYSQRLVISAN